MTKTSKLLLAEPPGTSPRSSLDYDSLAEAFPEVKAGLRPFGSKVLVQIRSPMKQTKSGFFLPDETVETERWNTQVAKVIALGPRR